MPPRTLKDRLWISFTVLLVSFLGFSPQIWLLPTYLDRQALVRHLVPFNALLLGLFTSYALCVTTDPGAVPAKWEPAGGVRENAEVKRTTGGPRYCNKCSAFKPARAHHCRACKRCVLRMDHHCNWVGGCIGHHNTAHFVRFLSFVCWSLSLHVYMLSLRVWDLAKGTEHNFFHPPATHEIVLLVFNLVFGVPILIAVGIFTLYHYHQLLTNTTTIEAFEKEKVATLIRRGRIQALKYPYDLGAVANVASVLGRRWWMWCWPLQPGPRDDADDEGKGLWFRIGEGSDEYTALCWPPKDLSYLPTAGPSARDPGRRGSDSSHTSDSATDEDDVPLAVLARRVRRGSEGWEVEQPADGIKDRIDRDKRAWEARREQMVREFERELQEGAGA